MLSRVIFILILMFNLLMSDSINADNFNECKLRVNRVVMGNYDRLNNPEYVQVFKSILYTESKVPIIVDMLKVYQRVSSDKFKSITSDNTIWNKLFKGEIVIVNDSYSKYVIYPIKSMNRTFITGIIILGYDNLFNLTEESELGIEVVGTYLSQILDLCKEIEYESSIYR